MSRIASECLFTCSFVRWSSILLYERCQILVHIFIGLFIHHGHYSLGIPALRSIHSTTLQSSLVLECVDKAARAGIVCRRRLLVVKLSQNLLCQRLAQLDTPLVETVDVPDGALSKGEMLVVDDQRTKGRRGDLVSKDRCRGTVAQEGLVRHEFVLRSLCLDLLRGLANHQSLCLSKEVGSEHPTYVSDDQFTPGPDLLLVLVVLHRVVALSSQNEISWDKLGSLVKQLVERVLSVRSRLAKQDRSGGVLDIVAIAGDGLAVRLHGELLEVGREPVQILVETEFI